MISSGLFVSGAAYLDNAIFALVEDKKISFKILLICGLSKTGYTGRKVENAVTVQSLGYTNLTLRSEPKLLPFSKIDRHFRSKPLISMLTTARDLLFHFLSPVGRNAGKSSSPGS